MLKKSQHLPAEGGASACWRISLIQEEKNDLALQETLAGYADGERRLWYLSSSSRQCLCALQMPSELCGIGCLSPPTSLWTSSV
jgi:hypothetical protein